MTTSLMRTPASNIADIVHEPNRRGACPTLDAPMQTGDGLLARIRIAGRVLSPGHLAELARLAAIHGNGIVEITARGNLQVRGLRADTSAAFARAVEELLPLDSGFVIDLSPLAGTDPSEIADPRPLARAIAEAARAFEARLGPKVSVVIDGGGQVCLAGVKGDIHLRATSPSQWLVTLGGGKPQSMDAEGAAATTLAILGALAAIGPQARATDLFPAPSGGPAMAPRQDFPPGYKLLDGMSMPVALPFGSARSDDIIRLADAAAEGDVARIRLAPHHMLLLDNATSAVMARVAALGFVTSVADLRRRVSACIGNQGCASGHIAAREIAGRIAEHVPQGQHLHVSGCGKGCAHPRPADTTLVGRPDGIGLVINGRAGDTPEQILDEAHLADALVHHQGGR